MTEIVVDSSVAIKWFVPQPYSIKAREILDAYQNGSLVLLVPDLIYAEIGNIVWKLQRFQGISEADGQAILDSFQLIKFIVTPSASLLGDAYHLAVTHQRTVYDSLYVALSLRRQCQFVTADEKLVNAVSGTFPNVVSITTWS
ncbi:type II toxin-antitoxin system VapC family toxin [Aerosakkonemataceae cyanobacterium BLCC-F50]|uniref:Type II toxin-antitoxin system VapC family toxin n=1 Tax=Floridaenema flaviceps BLCC-F50 TaxID=3153642 RepID=A0ABV4XZK4_9CYAN